jgi:hypothetical protein
MQQIVKVQDIVSYSVLSKEDHMKSVSFYHYMLLLFHQIDTSDNIQS